MGSSGSDGGGSGARGRDVTCVVVVGNPKPASRTLESASVIAERLTGRPPDAVIDLVELGPRLLGWGDPEVAEAVAKVKAAGVIVVASPTYKATFTGLLKLFLEQFEAGSLRGVVAYPVMLGASWAHSLAPDVFLKPVLAELGASCPAPGLYLLDSDHLAPEGLDAWIDVAARFVP